jgi:hypothetical protein
VVDISAKAAGPGCHTVTRVVTVRRPWHGTTGRARPRVCADVFNVHYGPLGLPVLSAWFIEEAAIVGRPLPCLARMISKFEYVGARNAFRVAQWTLWCSSDDDRAPLWRSERRRSRQAGRQAGRQAVLSGWAGLLGPAAMRRE